MSCGCSRSSPIFSRRALTLTTSSDSPAGAGIAGSSALNVAVCAALAEWRRQHYEPEALLQIAMNIEAQAINVPTGLQDYRPALYGGIAALELEVDGIHRVPLDVDPSELEQPDRPLLHRRAAQLGHEQLGDYEEAPRRRCHVFDCFERIRDTAGAMRAALGERRLGHASARAIAEEWENRNGSRRASRPRPSRS